MRKQLNLLLPIMAIAMLTGCSTYQYSSRYVDINRAPIGTKQTAAEVVVDYNRTVTATSDYQLTKNDAIKEAEHLCIVNNGIDVIVDPIFKVEYAPFELQKRYKAIVTGYAGKYAPAAAGVDAAKEYDMKDIEKYKMLTDPTFPQYYYNHGTGDSYYFNNSGTGASVKSSKGASVSSLAVAPKMVAPKMQDMDFRRAKSLRNWGLGLSSAGIVTALPIGLTSLLVGETEVFGPTCIVIGSAAFIAGIPCWIVGSARMKKANRNADISMGGTKNGVGLRLRF